MPTVSCRNAPGVEKTGKTSRAQEDVRMEGLMNQPATSVRNHCLSPARARVAIDGPLGSASYARMFPELPSFQADEQFLLALGRAGGLILDPFMIHELFPSLTETASGSHPCCVVSVTFDRTQCFHGANAGSNPAGDANSMACRRTIYSLFNRTIGLWAR